MLVFLKNHTQAGPNAAVRHQLQLKNTQLSPPVEFLLWDGGRRRFRAWGVVLGLEQPWWGGNAWPEEEKQIKQELFLCC